MNIEMYAALRNGWMSIEVVELTVGLVHDEHMDGGSFAAMSGWTAVSEGLHMSQSTCHPRSIIVLHGSCYAIVLSLQCHCWVNKGMYTNETL